MKRVVNASSTAAKRFAELYDSGDYDYDRGIYDKIHAILGEYGTEEDDIDILFDRADEGDQETLIKLSEKLIEGHNDLYKTSDDIKKKFTELQYKSERGVTSPYEDGYYDALCDMIDVYNISF